MMALSKYLLQNNDIIKWHITNSVSYTDEIAGYGQPFIAKIGVGEDVSNVYFFALIEAEKITSDSSNNVNLMPNVLSIEYGYQVDFKKIDFIDSNSNSKSILISDALPDSVHDLLIDPSIIDKDGRSLIFIAIDKSELPQIVTAMNALEADFDKRLVLRNKQNKVDSFGILNYTEYDLFIEGYKFNNGNVAVLEQSTNIKILNDKEYPRLFASSAAIENFDGLNSIDENRKHFSHSFLQTDALLNIRSTPAIMNNNVLFRARGLTYFTILQKTKDNQNQTWYNIEWKDGYVGIAPNTLNQPQKAPSSPNNNGWIRPNIKESNIFDRVFYPVASFEKFIIDFLNLTKGMDINANSQNDTLTQRITRIRQMTKEGGDISDLFDEIITQTNTIPDPPVRLNDLYNNVPVGASENLELFVDYFGIKLANNKIIDLHHLFIGLDVLNFKRVNFQITTYIFTLDISNNIDYSTWVGDIGAAPQDYINSKDAAYEVDWQTMNPNASQQEKESAFLTHYYKTRAKDEDLLADIYSHIMHSQLNTYLFYDPSFNNIATALYYFNLSIKSDDKRAFEEFFQYLNIDPTVPIIDQQNVYNYAKAEIHKFSIIWYQKDNIVEPSQSENLQLQNYSDIYAKRFLKWLEINK